MTDQLYGSELQPLSFASLSLTGTEAGGWFRGQFLVNFDIAAQYRPDVVEAEAEGAFPTFVRTDPNSKVIPLAITLMPAPNSQNMLDALKTAFSPSGDIDYLRVKDANGNTRRMRAKSLGLAPYLGDDQYNYVASLEAPEPVWESDTVSVSFMNVSGSTSADIAWEVTNPGNEECFPVITLTAYANRGGLGSGTHQLPVVIAWRSSLEGTDSQGYPYPLELTDGNWDYAAADDAVGDGSDIQVWLDGVEISRYYTPIIAENPLIWCSVPFQPARVATVASDDGTEIVVENPDDLAAFPDTGFLLSEGECIAYRGKSASKFLNCLRQQRETSAGTLSQGDPIYWVEHDIRITWGVDGVSRLAMSSADEKPIIDLEASTNAHHKYGTTDGLIEPESLRSGQWVRELRAPANGPRAKYASLGQTAGIVDFVDQLPSADAPNFDSLSLYTPCFASSNITGVALSVACDHHMMFSMYGVDVGGFESVIHRRSICGFFEGYDTGDSVQLATGTASIAPIVLLPDSDLARLTIEGRTSIVAGLDYISTAIGGIIANISGSAAQTFAIANQGELIEVSFQAGQGAAPYTGNVDISFIKGSDPDETPFFSFSVDASQILFTQNTIRLYDLSPNIGTAFRGSARETGSYTIRLDGSGSGDLAFAVTVPRNQGGQAYQQSGANWVAYLGDLDIVICLNGAGLEPQSDADVGTLRTVQVQDVTVHFDPDSTPLIVLGNNISAYILTEEALTNTDTGEAITMTGVLPIFDIADDCAKVDASGHVVSVLTDEATGAYEQPAGYFIEPSDIQNWIRLKAGLNHFTMSIEDAPRLAVRCYFRSRWT